MTGMGKFMKQAQKMQMDMAKAQEELKLKVVEASSGGGAVKIEMSCDKKVRSIAIDPSLLEDADVEMLQDLIMTATNQALDEVDRISAAEIGKLTQGLNIPGLNF